MDQDLVQKTIDVMKFVEAISKEGDRSSIIVGASQIDNELELLIGKVILPKVDKDDELFDNEKPLGTFSSKINMAYRLGLIDKEMRRTLHIFRKIRNDMSHLVYDCDIESQPHSNRIDELRKEVSKDTIYNSLCESIPSKFNWLGRSLSVRVYIVYIMARLAVLRDKLQPLYKINEITVKNNGY